MLMDTSTLSPEEAAIRIKEGELRQNVNGTWICSGAMILLALFSLSMSRPATVRASIGG